MPAHPTSPGATSPLEDGAVADRRALAREYLRDRVRAQCDVSRWLCERAGAERTRSDELRRLSTQQHSSWRQWWRLHRRVTGTAGPWPGRRPGGQAAERPIVRVCMYCARVYAALPLADAEGEADAAWRAVPPWVRQQLDAGRLSVVPSHGICPGCARRHGWTE